MNKNKIKKQIIILLCLFLIISIAVISNITQTIDSNIYTFFSTNKNDIITSIFRIITTFASSQMLIIITLALIFLLNTNHKRLFVIINTIISSAIIIISKNIFLRQRPFIGQEILSSYSFPSGHSLIATTYYGFLIYILNSSSTKPKIKIIGNICLSSLIILICISRLVLNVHYLTDIIAGVILGLILLLILISVYKETLNKKEKEKPLIKTLTYGFNGIIYTLKKERNMVIHFLVMFLVILSGIIFKISFYEWLICFILFSLVLSLELMNTALENVVDLVTKEKKEKAKIAKDAAAGSVLIAVIFAVIIGIIIFLPKLFTLYLGKL